MALVEIPGVPHGLHTVCWYHELQMNEQDRYLPHVNVVLRSQSHVYSKPYFHEIPVAITYLGQVRIGYMVSGDGNHGFVDGTHPISKEQFAVDFTRDSWEFGEAGDLGHLLFDISWLSGFEPRGPMLVFPLENGCSLWIPSTEFFSRCYGRSQEIKRILSLYPWMEAEKRLFGSGVMPAAPHGRTIRLKRSFVKDDVVFLSHVWHDEYTKNCAKWIYAQLESIFPRRVPRSQPWLPWKSFFRVRPWFEGPAELLVRGFWIGDARDKKFLALRVDGCTEPRDKQDKPIYYVRNYAKGASSGAAATATGGKIAPFKKRRKPEDVRRLTHSVEPDRGSSSIQLDDPLFEIIGGRQVVKEMKRGGRKTAIRLLPEKGDGSVLYSASEPHSTGKGVDGVSFAAPVYQPMGNVLLDMWKTLLHLQEKHPDLVSSVAWVAEEDSRFYYREEEPPELILLAPFSSEEDGELYRLDTRIRNWPWLDINDPQRGRRGLLVMRCLVRRHPVYFVEVQRRPEMQDNFSGMVFRLSRERSLGWWLEEICFRVRHDKGVFAKLLCSACPGVARNFIHFRPPPGTFLYEAAVVNALSKVGLSLPRQSALEGIGEENLSLF